MAVVQLVHGVEALPLEGLDERLVGGRLKVQRALSFYGSPYPEYELHETADQKAGGGEHL